MLPPIYSFKKSFDQRLKEFSHLYASEDTCCNIFKVWAFDLEYAIDEFNWQALWQLSEENCSQYEALFPTTVVVKVVEIIFDELTAAVTVEAVQDDLTFPDIVYVPLFELFPIQVQSSFTRFRNIADWLDRCRFFFLYLWYHWDSTLNPAKLISDWAEEHLANRLQLQYDIRNEVMDKATASYIQSLMTEAVQVADAISNNEESDPSEDRKLIVLKNLVRQENIKIELQLFEAPDLRKSMVTYIYQKKNIQADKDTVTILMPKDGKMGQISQFLAHVESTIGSDAKARILNDALYAFSSIQSLCTMIVSPGTHYLENLGGLAYGGIVKGMDTSNTVLTPALADPQKFMFLSCFGSVVFQNLTLKRSEGVQVCAFDGLLRLESCHLVGEPGCLARGIVVQPGCQLEMLNCKLSNLGTAIIAKNNSSIKLVSTIIQNCAEGVKIMDNVNATISDSVIENASIAAVVLESPLKRANQTSGTIDIFSDIINVTNSKFTSNKVDAMVSYLPNEIIIE